MIETAKILEAMMLILFGLSWPAQIHKTLKSRNPAGKSMLFLSLVLIGYFCGLASKFVGGTWRGNWVVLVYVADLLMVATDLLLTFYFTLKLKENLRKEK